MRKHRRAGTDGPVRVAAIGTARSSSGSHVTTRKPQRGARTSNGTGRSGGCRVSTSTCGRGLRSGFIKIVSYFRTR